MNHPAWLRLIHKRAGFLACAILNVFVTAPTYVVMPSLLLQLREATSVQGTVDTEITSLNATLQESRNRLDVTAADMIQATNGSINHAEELVSQSQAQVTHIGTQGTAAYNVLTGRAE